MFRRNFENHLCVNKCRNTRAKLNLRQKRRGRKEWLLNWRRKYDANCEKKDDLTNFEMSSLKAKLLNQITFDSFCFHMKTNRGCKLFEFCFSFANYDMKISYIHKCKID